MVAFSHLAFPLVLAALASAASYYPPFLTPTSADEWSNAFGYGCELSACTDPLPLIHFPPDIVSWNQTLPDGVNATDAATSATIGLGISSGDWGYYGESGFLYDAAVPVSSLLAAFPRRLKLSSFAHSAARAGLASLKISSVSISHVQLKS